ncbi:hypothetical protein RTE01_47670 [Raoultella terrigena]|nr:hypothetical protein RTE01_47670 [Raoultella terrigena]
MLGFPSVNKGVDCKSAVVDFKVRLERKRENVAAGNGPKGEELQLRIILPPVECKQ